MSVKVASYRALIVIAGALLLVLASCSDATNCHSDECAPATTSASSGGASGAGGSAGSPLATQYCDCMLLACHDAYHAKYGPETDEKAAREKCFADAEAVPVNGEVTDTGDFIECRIHHCEAAKTDETSCPSSVGNGECM